VGLNHHLVTGVFHSSNPSGRPMALELTQLTEIRTRKISWCYRQPVRRAENFAKFCANFSKTEHLKLLDPSVPVQTSLGFGLPLQLNF
jgi:hypothetical protein